VRGRLADVRPKGPDREVVVLDVVMEARSGEAEPVDAPLRQNVHLSR
jgi:hypothetical protein